MTVRLPRTTGLLSGVLVVLLGMWAALIPFVGPYFDYGFTPDEAWHYSSSRLWLHILPGAIAVVGGLLMILASRRHSGTLGGWLAMGAGAWLIVGPSLSLFWQDKAGIGSPLGGTHRQAVEWVGYYYGVGALIVGLAAFATGRFVSRPHVAEREVLAAAKREGGPVGATPTTAPATERERETPRSPATERPGATEGSTHAGQTAPAARAPAPEKAEGGQPADASAPAPKRTRRRRGGLVGRLFTGRSGS